MTSHQYAPKQEDPLQPLNIMHPHLLLRQNSAASATFHPYFLRWLIDTCFTILLLIMEVRRPI
ncbi:hypothetical protein Patl1_19403 [Pistacia atlantica]|uniref:Uncharacterized protein n=1 Tax=Pistacia atlantica TaxID=434234 RepID=A0ACC1BY59_9ROSI|nr:hypothetical protein Patl1_19403 [Pistacia atlantica]